MKTCYVYTGEPEVPGRGTRMLRHTGMFCKNGSFFCKKSVNIGPTFHEKNSLTMCPIFKIYANPRKFCEIARNGYFFQKNPKIWASSFGKIT